MPVPFRRLMGQIRTFPPAVALKFFRTTSHGVLPQTDPDVLARLAELVHTVSARARVNGPGPDANGSAAGSAG